MPGEWWTTFFDRTYTEVWAAAGMFEQSAEEADAVLDLLGADGPLRILDVPCGFGRHSAALHARGHEVTGLDLSADQLAIARERHPGPTYRRGDMRQPPSGPFDAVLNLFSSFGYLPTPAEDLAALRAWHDVLVPGGQLLIDTMHRDRIARFDSDGEERPIGDTGAVEISRTDWVAGTTTSTVILPDGSQRTFRVRLYTATALLALLAEAGFDDLRAQGGLEGGPVSPDRRLVVVGRRPA